CGTSQVTATSHPGGKSDTAILTVTCPTPVASVSVAPAAASVQVSGTVQLTATPKDANGAPLSGRTVTWASSNTAVASISGSATVTVQAPQPGCSTSSLAWLNSPFTAQTGSFTAQFDATPNGASIDGVTGLSAGAAAGYADLAAIVRFNAAGQIDARNGAAYAAASVIPYTAGTTYRFRLVVDVPSHTYAAYVTPAGGTEATIGTGYAFRTEQAAVASLANSTAYSDAGTHTGCNFAITGTTPPVSVATVDVAPATANVTVGGTVQLVATPRDANGTPLSGRTVSWSSSNTGVASVTGSGLVTGVGAG